EVLACLDLATGKPIWERGFSDFISDIIYERYSIGAPSIDPETGNVYAFTSPGLLVAFTPDGEPLWESSLMEALGRLTFPNGRTGSPAIEGDLVIVNAISTNWGTQGPARNRFYAFDKRTGAVVWAATPGTTPRDSSFSTPVFAWRNGRRVFYAGTGCGHVVCVDAQSGATVWRYRISAGGVNSSPVIAGNRLIAIHGKENLDETASGRMVALDLAGAVLESGDLDPKAELWRNPLQMFTSSPTLHGDTVYQMTAKGELCAVDVGSGTIRWRTKLAPSQLHASPLHAGGLLYVPLWNGEVHVIQPGAEAPETVSKQQLEGACIGSATAWRGRLFIHTTEKLYCFASPTEDNAATAVKAPETSTTLTVVPAEIVLRPGESVSLRLFESGPQSLDPVEGGAAVQWAVVPFKKGVPGPTVEVDAAGRVTAPASARPSVGYIRARVGDRQASARVRVVTRDLREDFEATKLGLETKDGTPFAHPPGSWIGGRLKWEVRDVDGSKALAKTLDRVLFQRCMTFIGHPEESGYTIEADVRSDGNRRLQSNVGVICQRYIVMLEGNWQQLQVVSNHDRVKVTVPFAWKPKRWYRIQARVDAGPGGGVIVRAKAWPRGEEPPAAWLIEVALPQGHDHGAPGLFGFSPQSRYRVYVDNIAVYPTDKE
ncbi:MAG: outer membrane protein assembly factor BamB family protein, partial [Planctomycetota bacterium]